MWIDIWIDMDTYVDRYMIWIDMWIDNDRYMVDMDRIDMDRIDAKEFGTSILKGISNGTMRPLTPRETLRFGICSEVVGNIASKPRAAKSRGLIFTNPSIFL